MSFLTRFSLRNRAVIVLLSLLIVGLGLYSMTALKQELVPNVETPTASVLTSYPGASPQVVEREITRPIEDAVRGIGDVEATTSTSTTGTSQVSVQWKYGISTDQMRNDLQAAVDQLKSSLPADVEPTVSTFDFNSFPVVMLGVSSDLPQERLGELLEDVAAPQLSQLTGVANVQVSGQPVREVVVTLRQRDLDRHNVDPSQIQELFGAYGAQVPAGQLEVNNRDVTVQVGKTLTTVDDVKNLRLSGQDDDVRLADVADVADVPAENSSISHVDGKPALSVIVTKTAEANTVEVANAVQAQLPQLSQQLGGNTRFSTIFDQAPYIEDSIKDLGVEGGLGLMMAILVILVFLWSLRPTLISAVSIPLSLFLALIGLFITGNTLNMFTLAALTISIGRVVDDSIVVIENIQRHQSAGEEFGAPMIVNAVKEVASAITASTITTVAVFLPVALVGGEVGELFRPFSVTVAVALGGSLLVALTIVPVLAYWFMRPSQRPISAEKAARKQAKDDALAAREAEREERTQEKATARIQAKEQALVQRMQRQHKPPQEIADKVATLRAKFPAATSLPDQHSAHSSAQTPLQRGYLPILRWSLRHPLITSAAAILIFILTMAMTPLLKTDFLGSGGQPTIQITQTLPTGTALSETERKARPIEETLSKNPDLTTYSLDIGGSPGSGTEAAYSSAGGNNVAQFYVTLNEGVDTQAAMDRVRNEILELPDIGEIKVTAAGGGASDEVAVEVHGNDEEAVAQGTAQVTQLFRQDPTLTEVSSDLAEAQTTFQVQVDEKKAADYGMNQATIGQAVTEALTGSQLGTMRIDDSEQEVMLRSREPVKTKQELENLDLPVTQKQTADAQQKENDAIQDEQDQLADEQTADQEEQSAAAENQTRDQRADLVDQIGELRDQLNQAQSAPGGPGASAPGGGGMANGDPTAQIRDQIDSLQEQIDQLDEQAAESREQRTRAKDQADRSEQLTDRAENVTDIKGKSLKLRDVATVNEVELPAAVTRVDGSRTVTVTATPTTDLGTATSQVQQGIATLDLPSGVTAKIAGTSQQQQEQFASLYLAMGVAMVIVYIVMVATFRSLLQPLILMVSVPFAATGAIGMLLLTNTPMSIPAMIGMLMLIGIVVTNAIVLIDLINHYRRQGASIDGAVIHGSRLRLRPIIMTATATIGALLPMFFGLTGSGVFISQGLAVVVVGGLISSTILTLILVPVLYHLVEKFRERIGSEKPRPPRAADPDQPTDSLRTLFDPRRRRDDGRPPAVPAD